MSLESLWIVRYDMGIIIFLGYAWKILSGKLLNEQQIFLKETGGTWQNCILLVSLNLIFE